MASGGISWKSMVKYPNLIHLMLPSVLDTLDTLNELLPMWMERDRLGTWIAWLNRARSLGLITEVEYRAIQHELIHGCGGL